MLGFLELLRMSLDASASDFFIVSGQPLSYKTEGRIMALDQEKVMPDTARDLVEEAYREAGRSMKLLEETGDDDFAVSVKGLARFRISTYKQRGSLAAVIRVISFGIPDYRELGIPEKVMSVADITKGLVLVTGSAGHGKSTTLACIIDRINKTRSGHIITLEEPIEFLYRNDKSIISQREIELDTLDYVTALRACLRQAPDVILLGEMRDHETAETGHLVLSTLHTLGAVNTIDRVIDIFPPHQQHQIRMQLSSQLSSVISQQLVPTVAGGIVPVFEIMHVNNAIRNMIREAKTHQIDSTLGVSAAEGMVSMDMSLLELYRKGIITAETAIRYCLSPERMEKRLENQNGDERQ